MKRDPGTFSATNGPAVPAQEAPKAGISGTVHLSAGLVKPAQQFGFSSG